MEICRWCGRWKTAGLQIWRYQRFLKVAVPQSMWLFKAEWKWTVAKRTGRQETKWRWVSIPWESSICETDQLFQFTVSMEGGSSSPHASLNNFVLLCTVQQDLFGLCGHSRSPAWAMMGVWEFLVPLSSVLCCVSKSWGNDYKQEEERCYGCGDDHKSSVGKSEK